MLEWKVLVNTHNTHVKELALTAFSQALPWTLMISKPSAQKAATPTQQPSVEATCPPGDEAGAGATGAGAQGPAGAREGCAFWDILLILPPHLSRRILRYFYWCRQQVFTTKALSIKCWTVTNSRLLCKGEYLFMSNLTGVLLWKLHLHTFHVENLNFSNC